jgi:hypothetical protein
MLNFTPGKILRVRFLVLNATFNNITVIIIVAVCFISGENRNTRRNSLTNFITYCCIEFTMLERGSNSQR